MHSLSISFLLSKPRLQTQAYDPSKFLHSPNFASPHISSVSHSFISTQALESEKSFCTNPYSRYTYTGNYYPYDMGHIEQIVKKI